MLNRILKPLILGFFTLVIITNLSSCKKEKETIAIIVVKNDAGIPISDARVVLHALNLENSISSYNADNYSSFDDLIWYNLDTSYSPQGQVSSVFVADWTDENGRAEFTFPHAMILNATAMQKVDNNIERFGKNVINIKKEQITTQVVEIRN